LAAKGTRRLRSPAIAEYFREDCYKINLIGELNLTFRTAVRSAM
jgi:hypothetical protein